jgi:hypothetical protein
LATLGQFFRERKIRRQTRDQGSATIIKKLVERAEGLIEQIDNQESVVPPNDQEHVINSEKIGKVKKPHKSVL